MLFDTLRNRFFTKHSRRRFPIYVDAPPYNARSGGSRAINLLAYHLTRLGYDAYVTTLPTGGTTALPGMRFLDDEVRANHEIEGRKPIAVYPEVTVGNPLGAPFVIRYLLNKPGYIAPGSELSYGDEDLYICFDLGYAPVGRTAFDLYVPLVDKSVYFSPSTPTDREGFVIFSHHEKPDFAALPDWVRPRVHVSMDAPRSHKELAELYRGSVAMVTWERSAAIYEALCCGCPVICLPNGSFREASYQKRFGGAGLVWGFDESRLAKAGPETRHFQLMYELLERNLDKRIGAAFDSCMRRFRKRQGHRAPTHLSLMDGSALGPCGRGD